MKLFGYTPIFWTSLREYSKESLSADAMAGVIVGIVALPLAIAFAIASGVSPEKGIIKDDKELLSITEIHLS